MFTRFIKIVSILVLFVFTTGFLPFSALFGPGLPIASSGNVYKASAQYFIDRHVKIKTGKIKLDPNNVQGEIKFRKRGY